MMAVTEKGLERLKSRGHLPEDFLQKVAEFFREYAEKFHFGKEEGRFFEEMEEAGVFQQLPIESIVEEHYIGRSYLKKIAKAACECRFDDAQWLQETVRCLEGFIDHLRSHSRKENRILYPLSESLIPPERDEKIMESYRQIEAKYPGYQEKYSRMVEELERAFGDQ
jgi:hemerythrin-like domain-containing protein